MQCLSKSMVHILTYIFMVQEHPKVGEYSLVIQVIDQVLLVHTEQGLGTVRGDVGHGQGFGKSLGDAHDSAAKEAVTDALKRALRSFGNPFGLALYDKTKANVGVEAGDNEIEAAIEGVNACDSLESLIGYWSNLNKNAKHVAADGRVIQAKDVRKTELEK